MDPMHFITSSLHHFISLQEPTKSSLLGLNGSQVKSLGMKGLHARKLMTLIEGGGVMPSPSDSVAKGNTLYENAPRPPTNK
jgi:hypothetical protein